jgi:hypothetical protein
VPQAATENRIADAVMACLHSIGTPASSWLSSGVVVAEGVPGNNVDVTDGPKVFVDYRGTAPVQPEADTARHFHQATFVAWCFARTTRDLVSLKADILRAIFAAESTFISQFQQPMWPGEFKPRPDMSDAGIAVGMQVLTVDVYMEHSAP